MPADSRNSPSLLQVLPRLSLDVNPIVGLQKQMRKEVTRHHCHATLGELFDARKSLVHTISEKLLDIIRRQSPRFDLNPDIE